MAIITLDSRTQRTYDVAQKTLYVGIGKLSPWSNELSPDAPDEYNSAVTELKFIAKVQNVKYVKPAVGGSIVYRDSNWTEVLEANIFTESVVNLYLDVTLNYDNYPLVNYRQIGLLEDPLNLLSAVCTLQKYEDHEISSQGILHYLDNRLVTNRSIDQQEKISIILEF